MKLSGCLFLTCIVINARVSAQAFDSSAYHITVDTTANEFFKSDPHWRGGDGASSIDLGHGKILWLFGDSFICKDSSASRQGATLVRNSIAIQYGYQLSTASVKFYWRGKRSEPTSFFPERQSNWFWPGHGVMIRNRLLIFFMRERRVSNGLGFETAGWSAAIVFNPQDNPAKWKMKFIDGPQTFGTVAGSAAVLTKGNYVYAFGAVEPGSHDAYLMRWKISSAYTGNFSGTQWWSNGRWAARERNVPVQALFAGATEYSVHYDSSQKKYLQVQSFGFGESSIGLRIADHIQGPWSAPYQVYTPAYTGIRKPFMYAAKAHPELKGNGLMVTYNINSFDFDELIASPTIYFPRFIRLNIQGIQPIVKKR